MPEITLQKAVWKITLRIVDNHRRETKNIAGCSKKASLEALSTVNFFSTLSPKKASVDHKMEPREIANIFLENI